jgi:hypothetical protein
VILIFDYIYNSIYDERNAIVRGGLQELQRHVGCIRLRECEIFHLEKISTARIKKFNAAMNQYRTYIRKENQLLDRNSNHCEQRNRWYREQIDLSWKNGIANRHLILRSVARTNVLKKDLDDWLERVD